MLLTFIQTLKILLLYSKNKTNVHNLHLNDCICNETCQITNISIQAVT